MKKVHNSSDIERYDLLSLGMTRCYFIGPLLAAFGAGASALAAPVIGAAAAVAGPVIGAAGLAAGAIGSTAAAGVGALSSAIPAVIGGVSKLATVAKPAAELFGAGYGVYQSMEQLKVQKRALELAEKQYATSAQISQEELGMRGAIPPIETFATRARPLPGPTQEELEAKGYVAPPQWPELLVTYGPVLLIALLLWKVRK